MTNSTLCSFPFSCHTLLPMLFHSQAVGDPILDAFNGHGRKRTQFEFLLSIQLLFIRSSSLWTELVASGTDVDLKPNWLSQAIQLEVCSDSAPSQSMCSAYLLLYISCGMNTMLNSLNCILCAAAYERKSISRFESEHFNSIVNVRCTHRNYACVRRRTCKSTPLEHISLLFLPSFALLETQLLRRLPQTIRASGQNKSVQLQFYYCALRR